MSCYWGNNRAAAARRDQSLPYLEQYRIDMEQFKELFITLTPWSCGAHTPVLAGRLFRLLDENRDSLINFKEFVTGMSKWYFWRWCITKNVSIIFQAEYWKEMLMIELLWREGGSPTGFRCSGRTKDAFLLLDSLSFWDTVGGKPTRWNFALGSFVASTEGFVQFSNSSLHGNLFCFEIVCREWFLILNAVFLILLFLCCFFFHLQVGCTMVTSLKSSKYFTNCICLLVSDCFHKLLLVSMVCSDTQLKRDAS